MRSVSTMALGGVAAIALLGGALVAPATTGPGAAAPASSAPSRGPDGGTVVAERGPAVTLARHASDPRVVVDPDGITVFWVRERKPQVLRAARLPDGGPWGEPVTLGRISDVHEYAVASDAAGALTAIWSARRPGYTTGVRASRRPAGGSWTDPVTLTTDVPAPDYHGPRQEGIYGAQRLDLDLSAAGTAMATWSWGSFDRGVKYRVRAAFRRPGQSWLPSRPATPRSWSLSAQAVLAADGVGTVVHSNGRRLVAARGRAGEAWSSPAVLAHRTLERVGLAVGPTGDVLVTFGVDPPGRRWRSLVRAREYRPGSGWTAASRLRPLRFALEGPQAHVDSAGTAVLVRAEALDPTGAYRLVLRRRPIASSWSAPVVVAPLASEEIYGWEAGLTGEPNGWVLLRWVAPNPVSYDDTFARLLSPDGVLGVGFALAPPGVPMVDAAPTDLGSVVVAWQDQSDRVRVQIRTG